MLNQNEYPLQYFLKIIVSPSYEIVYILRLGQTHKIIEDIGWAVLYFHLSL